ncbi:FHA domain-containing protein [Brasilonema sp. UFV-L1]|uniref:FHA domain-containing protein n=1 Tax=Brasilonema sp. UFV-L1 TaxID=2234130 RepID=UPI00145C511B|nr:FHA domain-containing protein [Brasilonema sp. UFV-L1]NMG08506.1 FHA domain-containing protein [Brasilonema sp. UFV-L1]
MENPGRSQTTGLSLELFHVQTDTPLELPPNFTAIRIGKPKDKIVPDINVAGFPDATFVSRLHAEIQVEKKTYYVVDLGSVNGTYLNNIKLDPNKRYPLKFGDKIDLGHGGKVTFIFLQKQEIVTQSENTTLNNPPTVIQIELLENTKPSKMERFTKFMGLVLMIAGILILTVNTQISSSVRIPGVLLCVAGVVVLTWRRTYRNVAWFLMALGITIMFFSSNAFSPVSLLAILASCALLVVGCQLLTTGKILNYGLNRNY